MGERASGDENVDERGSADGGERTPAGTPATASERARTGALAGADDPLVVWALATFHVTTLVALLVVGLYLGGSAGDLLGALDTLVGLALFVVLWAITWWTTRNVVRELGDHEAGAEGGSEDGEGEGDESQRGKSEGGTSFFAVVFVGAKWGGANGVVFLWLLLVGFAVLNLPAEIGRALDAVPFFLFAAAVGSLLALGIGAIIGSLFAALDVALFRMADWVAPVADE